MIVRGHVFSLEKLKAKHYDNPLVPGKMRLLPRRVSLRSGPPIGLIQGMPVEKPQNNCCQMLKSPFNVHTDEYWLGYNLLFQISNFRAILDGLSDIGLLVIIWLMTREPEKYRLYLLGFPWLFYNTLTFLELFKLKKQGNAEVSDILFNFVEILLSIYCILGFWIESEHLILRTLGLFMLQMTYFILTRICKGRSNKNVNSYFGKVLFTFQTFLFAMKLKNVIKTSSIVLITMPYFVIGLIGSIISAIQILSSLLGLLSKIYTCLKKCLFKCFTKEMTEAERAEDQEPSSSCQTDLILNLSVVFAPALAGLLWAWDSYNCCQASRISQKDRPKVQDCPLKEENLYFYTMNGCVGVMAVYSVLRLVLGVTAAKSINKGLQLNEARGVQQKLHTLLLLLFFKKDYQRF